MHDRIPMFADVWTVALAAGAGRRVASLTGGAPKQFWRPPGGGDSLVEATLARLHPLAAPERTVTIVDRGHLSYVESLPNRGRLGIVEFQPMDRGTAAGVLLPLLTVLTAAPDAIVVVTPTDHGVESREAFRNGLTQAVHRVRAGESDLVLFGVEPTAVAADYGWITPEVRGAVGRGAFQAVAGFVEKPSLREASRLYSAGAVWNTMVLVGRGSSLLGRYRRHLPFLTEVLTKAATAPAGERSRFLSEWYPELPAADFSRDLLTPSRPLCLYTWPAAIGWSDLGTPERLEEWLAARQAA